jgi:two-component system LytT family response regulator
MTWRALIIDDEPPARKHLRRLLAEHPQIEVIGEAASVAEASEICERMRPGLLFLDVQMPRATGFDLLPKLNPVPKIVFVTAHEEFALRAFEVNAVDYLMKPVFADRLALALKRVLNGSGLDPGADDPLEAGDSIFLQDGRTLRMVPLREIICIMAEGNYSTVVLSDGKEFLIYRTLNQWERRLPNSLFVRLDRSILINLTHLLEVKIIDRDAAQMRLAGRKEPVPLGRTAINRMRVSLQERLS